MFIDKFYRLYNPYSTVGEARSSKDPTINFIDDSWDASNFKITNVLDGSHFQDVSTLGQTLTRKNDAFVQGKRKFEFLELDASSGNWDGKKRKIVNVEKGDDPQDVAIVEQTLVRKDDGFVQGKSKFEFLESQNNNWDAKNKKIVNIKNAENPKDVPSLEQVLTRKGGNTFMQGKNKFEFLELQNNKWDVKNKKIIRAAKAEQPQDVPILSQTLVRKGEGFVQDKNQYQFLELDSTNKWNGKNRKIGGIKKGENLDDVVTLEQTLIRNKDGGFVQGNDKYEFLELQNNNWDVKNKNFVNIRKAKDPFEVPTLEQTLTRKGDAFVQDNNKYEFLELKGEVWDSKSKRLSNLKPGEEPYDAVILAQIPDFHDRSWKFRNYRLTHVSPAREDFDCVVKKQTITYSKHGFNFDAKNHKIENLASGTKPTDAATVGQILSYDEKNNHFKYGDKVFQLMEYNPNLLVKDTSSKSGFKTLDGKEYLPDNYVFTNKNGHLVSSRENYFYMNDGDDKYLMTKEK